MKRLSIIIFAALGSLILVFTTANSQQVDNTMSTQSQAPISPEGFVQKSDDEWKSQLTKEQYRIARKHGTEPPNGQIYKEFKKQGDGQYYCIGCGTHLFGSDTKFDSKSGWPSFYAPAENKNIKTIVDHAFGMKRVEVRCNTCDAHLGHVFEGEGFNTPTDQRYCINGTVLTFVPESSEAQTSETEENIEADTAE